MLCALSHHSAMPDAISFYAKRRERVLHGPTKSPSQLAGSKRRLSQDQEHESNDAKRSKPSASDSESRRSQSTAGGSMIDGGQTSQPSFDQIGSTSQSSSANQSNQQLSDPSESVDPSSIAQNSSQQVFDRASSAEPSSITQHPNQQPLAQIGSTNQISGPQEPSHQLFGQGSPAKELHRTAEEEPLKPNENDFAGEMIQRQPNVNEDTVTYPSLSSSARSTTSNIFKNIVQDPPSEVSGDVSGNASGDVSQSAVGTGFSTDPRKRNVPNAGSANLPPISHDNMNAIPATQPSGNTNLFAGKLRMHSKLFSKPRSSFKLAGAQPGNTSESSPSTMAEKPAFKVPTFGSGETANWTGQFDKYAMASKDEAKAKRKAQDYDSDEETEAQWERKDAEKERAKKQKLESISSAAPKFVPNLDVVNERGHETSANDSWPKAPLAPMFGTNASANDSPPKAPLAPMFGTNASANDSLPKAPLAPMFGTNASANSFGANASATSFGTNTPTNFMPPPSKSASDSEKPQTAKRKADEYDSSEDQEVDSERTKAEELRTKKQKLNKPFEDRSESDSEGDVSNSEAGSHGSFSERQPEGLSESVFDQPHELATSGSNIFGHLADNNNQDTESEDSEISQIPDNLDADDSESSGSDSEDSTQGVSDLTGLPEQSTPHLDESDKTTGSPDSNADNSSSNPKPAESSVPEGRSLFDRISRDENGKPIREIPPAEPKKDSVFSSLMDQHRAKTAESNVPPQPFTGFDFSKNDAPPQPSTELDMNKKDASKPKSIFGQPSTLRKSTSKPGPDVSPGDHTWKTDSPIKFGGTSNDTAPPVNASFSSTTAGGLFGSTVSPFGLLPKPATNIFSAPSSKGHEVGFAFGPKAAASPLFPTSDAPANESTATSPGASSFGGSIPGDEPGSPPDNYRQINLMKARGEENEENLFETRAKALTYDAKEEKWVTHCVGPLRVLKHRETGKTRILMRSDPSGRIFINTALLAGIEYKFARPTAVKIAVIQDDGKLKNYTIRVKEEEDAIQLAKVLEENKGK